MRALVATPFITIASNLSSHRAAQGVIYADQIRQSGKDVTVNMTLDFYHKDFNEFDELYIYHGNDWSGHLNLFGGLKEFPYIDNFVNFSKFKGKVYSLMIPHPDYYADLQHKMKLMKEKNKEINPMWAEVDWPNLQRMISTAEVVNPNELVLYDKAAMGDSHAICMYRPGWMVNSVPFKTLHGALKMGLKSFYPTDKIPFKQLEFYFGNIDIRHHLMRQPDPDSATRDLVKKYFDEAKYIVNVTGSEIKIYEPLPIENESRSIPKTGWYEKTPFYGSWDERNNVRDIFIDEAIKQQGNGVTFFRWCEKLKNNKGELDFKYMEKPQSVHLSREFYPHWQGREYNTKQHQANSVMGLFA
jgi:hypothetical protein